MSSIQGSFLQAGTSNTYEIGQSIKFGASSSQYLSRASGASGDSTRKFTIGAWIKLTGQDSSGCHSIIGASTDDFRVGYNPDSAMELTLIFNGDASYRVASTRVLRDVSAWRFVLASVDTTQATSSDIVKLYDNGELITSLAQTSYPTQNYDCHFGSNTTYSVGGYNGGASAYFDGCVAQVLYIDGLCIQQSDFTIDDFVETNNDGVLVPKSLSNLSYGSLGFLVEDATGTDNSGNGNDLTPSGSPVDSSDTPTNNYAVLNTMSNIFDSKATLSNANLSYSYGGSGNGEVGGTLVIPADTDDDYVIEFTGVATGANAAYVGLIGASTLGVASGLSGSDEIAWNGANSTVSINGVAQSAITSGTTIRMEYDGGANEVEVFTDGVSRATYSWTPSNDFTFVIGRAQGTATATVNVGQLAWANTPTAGFVGWSTANLSTPTVANLAAHFALATDTGANIVTALDAEISGTWSSWAKLYKDRDSAGSWKIRFSDDTSNMLALESTNAKASWSAPSGSNNFLGVAINCSTYAKTGTVSHTNGAATTVTHDLGTTDVVIMMKDEAGSEPVWWFHPDFDSGELAKTTDTFAPAASTAITNITSSSFDIGSGEATGTKRYLVMAEVDGLFYTGKATGNANADGPMNEAGSLDFVVSKRSDSGNGDWYQFDAVRAISNERTNDMRLNGTNAENYSASTAIDLLAIGFKYRSQNGSDFNASSVPMVWFGWGRATGGATVAPATAR